MNKKQAKKHILENYGKAFFIREKQNELQLINYRFRSVTLSVSGFRGEWKRAIERLEEKTGHEVFYMPSLESLQDEYTQIRESIAALGKELAHPDMTLEDIRLSSDLIANNMRSLEIIAESIKQYSK